MMARLTSPQYMVLLIGGAAVIGTVMILAVFLLQRSLGRGKTRQTQNIPS